MLLIRDTAGAICHHVATKQSSTSDSEGPATTEWRVSEYPSNAHSGDSGSLWVSLAECAAGQPTLHTLGTCQDQPLWSPECTHPICSLSARPTKMRCLQLTTVPKF